MNIEILNNSFMPILFVDVYESLIWTERYSSYGDFELYMAVDADLLSIIRPDYYAKLDDTDSVMIIENIEIETDTENGNHLKISGRSLESILERRIIWSKTTLDGKLPGQVKKLLDQNVISPELSERKISNFIVEDPTDEAVSVKNISAQYTGDNLYDTIQSICEVYGLGFKMTLNSSNQFVFKLYSGTDRSYGIDLLIDSEGGVIQDSNSDYIWGYPISNLVEFSPHFDNLINSDYIESYKTLKNVNLVAGEGEGDERRTTVIGEASGLDRRELYTDARDIQSENEDGSNISDNEYIALLEQRGYEKLAECQMTRGFECNIDYANSFIYGRDFFKGDIVKITNEYGITAKARITEIVRSQDESGYEMYPTFEII